MKRNKILITQLTFIFIGLSFLSCNKVETSSIIENDVCSNEAEIISFDSLKCGLCWGWIIKVGNDTIKTRDESNLGIGSRFGYTFNENREIYISLGGPVNEPLRDYPYYEIECIEGRN